MRNPRVADERTHMQRPSNVVLQAMLCARLAPSSILSNKFCIISSERTQSRRGHNCAIRAERVDALHRRHFLWHFTRKLLQDMATYVVSRDVVIAQDEAALPDRASIIGRRY